MMGYINPLLRLPAARKLLQLPIEQRLALAAVLRELREASNTEAELSWRRRKGPMAAYWRAVSTYSRHFAHALSHTTIPQTAHEACPCPTVNESLDVDSQERDPRTIDMFEAKPK